MRRIIIRHLMLLSLPLILGLGARWAVVRAQKSCGELVGPLFSAKCGRIQRDYYLMVQTGGTAAGCVLAAAIGIWLERRRTRAASRPAAPTAPVT
jgi:hypothetical protein